jgi:hypothetical protein
MRSGQRYFPFSCTNPRERERERVWDIYICSWKKKREFFFFWTKTKRERVRAFHATVSMEKMMQRCMKELEKSREEKIELTKGCCPTEKNMQFFFFDFLLLNSNYAQQRNEESYWFEGRSELQCSVFCCKNRRTLREKERTEKEFWENSSREEEYAICERSHHFIEK